MRSMDVLGSLKYCKSRACLKVPFTLALSGTHVAKTKVLSEEARTGRHNMNTNISHVESVPLVTVFSASPANYSQSPASLLINPSNRVELPYRYH
jgi:hypothetical protein